MKRSTETQAREAVQDGEVLPAERPGPSAELFAPFPLVRVCDIDEIVEQDWLVEGLIPRFDDGAAGYIFGAAKARKSLLLCDLAVSVASGTPALQHFPVRRRGSVVGFFAEDPRGEVARRMNRLARGRDIQMPENIYLLQTPGLQLDDYFHQERLANSLRGVNDLAMVWLDPMVRLHSINDNRAEELAPIHSFLRSLARQLPSAVIVLAHHTSRAGGSRGSSDYDAFGDFNVYLSKKSDHVTSINRIENRGGPPGDPVSFSVQDEVTDSGPALRLVVTGAVDETGGAGSRDANVRAAIGRYRLGNPESTGKKALVAIRSSGIAVANGTFWELWKATPSDGA